MTDQEMASARGQPTSKSAVAHGAASRAAVADDVDLATELRRQLERQLEEECLAMAEYALRNGLLMSRSTLIALREVLGHQATKSDELQARSVAA